MLEVVFLEQVKCDPTPVRDPVMLLSKTVCQECITHREWKRNVNDYPSVHMSDFSLVEEVFTASETM